MGRSKKEVVPEGTVEFDVLVDGKYQRRVGRGILVEAKPDGIEVAMCCGPNTVFAALMALEEFVEEHDLKKEWELYRTLRSIDTSNFEDAMKKLDEIWESMT